MMKFKNILLLMLILVILVLVCGLMELDLFNDLLEVIVDNVELDLFYNNVVKEFVDFVDEISDEIMFYVWMIVMFGGFQYNNQDGFGDFNFLWLQVYNNLMLDINLVLELVGE